MLYEIDTSQNSNINWAAKGNERILQNVANLLSTYRYEVAYNRGLGLPVDLIDLPIQVQRARLTTAVIELISVYEPRATVKEVSIQGIDQNGNISCKVVVEI